ncbi:MAG: hypothetical protein KJ077_04265 [Anaerolineae bacterium]|nr:hypothetical protein [Anaerolineae bacterium]
MKHLDSCPRSTGLRYLAWLLLKCPRSHEEVVSRMIEPVKFAENWASWWQCPACGGWHVTIVEAQQGARLGTEYVSELTK